MLRHLYCIFIHHRHQRFYSLLDRFRATVADSRSPTPPVTSHPLDGDPPPAPELVIADKVGNQRIGGLRVDSGILCIGPCVFFTILRNLTCGFYHFKMD